MTGIGNSYQFYVMDPVDSKILVNPKEVKSLIVYSNEKPQVDN